MPLFSRKKKEQVSELPKSSMNSVPPYQSQPQTQTKTHHSSPRSTPKTNGTPDQARGHKQTTASQPHQPTGPGSVQTREDPSESTQAMKPKLVFHCQQAQGSPTGIISGFTNVKELYKKIAETYEMPTEEILFCTLNTHKVDMARLLGGQIGLDDFIFAHIKGQPKELDIEKHEDALGLTITDNGAGYAFVKRIKEGSIMDKMPYVEVGDHLEKLDGKSLVGCRHFEVAKMLKEIPKNTTFTLRLVAPLKSGFANIGPSTGKKSGGSSYGSGKETLRLRSKGPATVETPDEVVSVAVDKINGLLENFMGINDTELSQSIWEIGSSVENPHNFAMAIDDSELNDFGFTDDFVFDLWGAISDAKAGRLTSPDVTDFDEKF